jgi:predicted ArsR family transcriptional regulator
LTDEARHIFPKSYDSLLNRLIDVLKKKMSKGSLNSVFTDVGKKIAANTDRGPELSLDQRVDTALDSLAELGGAARVERSGNTVSIKSESCPFADAVIEHPEICKVAESMISEIVGKPVHESCDRTASPKCRFAIDTV